MTYEPELGQALFGQPSQSHELPYDWSACIGALGHLIDRAHGINPTRNSAERFECDAFKMYAYAWGDDEQPFNFAWRDCRISWYKYGGRGESCNGATLTAPLSEMMMECIPAIPGGREV